MEDDDNDGFDDFDIENDAMIRLLENEENQYRSTQLVQDVPMPTINQEQQDVLMPVFKPEPQMNLIDDVEESNVANLATTSSFDYNPHGMQEIEDDFHFDLQRQGYNERAYDNPTMDLINARKEIKVQNHTIDALKLEVERYKSLARREDTPMREIADTKAQLDRRIFPSTDSFSVKRTNYESKSTHNRLNRPIKRSMSSHKVIPARTIPLSSLSMASQRTDVSMESAITPVSVIDHNKIEKQASVNKLLAILLGDSFLKWRKNSSVQISVDLTQTQMNELCQLEANKLLPTMNCSPDSRKRLKLVHNDYIDILLNYESSGILQKLLNMFRLSLTFALKENQHAIVIYIVSKIKSLVMTFPDAIDILYNEFIRMDTTSTLFFVAKALNLFYTDINIEIPENLKYQLPDLTDLTLFELTNLTNDYSINPDIILKLTRQRIKPEAAINGTLSILQIILTISKRVKQSLFIWLLNDASFINLLSNTMPDVIIFNALHVVDTYTRENFATVLKNDKENSLVKRLVDMIQSPPLRMPQDKVFYLQEQIIKTLQRMTASPLPLEVFKCLYQEIVPVLITLINNKIEDSSLHGHPRFTQSIERSIVSCIFLLACLSAYSHHDEKYPPRVLAEVVDKASFIADANPRKISEQTARQIKEQINYINTQLSSNVIMIE